MIIILQMIILIIILILSFYASAECPTRENSIKIEQKDFLINCTEATLLDYVGHYHCCPPPTDKMVGIDECNNFFHAYIKINGDQQKLCF